MTSMMTPYDTFLSARIMRVLSSCLGKAFFNTETRSFLSTGLFWKKNLPSWEIVKTRSSSLLVEAYLVEGSSSLMFGCSMKLEVTRKNKSIRNSISTIGVRLMIDFVIRFSLNRIVLFKFMFSNFNLVGVIHELPLHTNRNSFRMPI